MMNIFLFVLCLVINGGIHKVHGIQNTLKEDLELERQQQLINKPHIKSIRTKFGEIIDCIDINKQPAFDHPLLKNHKLQRKPNFKISSVKDSTTRFIFGLKKDQYCPSGTVPIQRITKGDLIGDKLLNSHTLTQSTPGDHFAEVSLVPGLGPYYGVSGSLSVYNPKVEKDQISASTLWVQNGDANRIEFGWHVNPSLYGDDTTYIYSRWTRDNYKQTGCFNMQCPGFVQTHKGIYLGTRVDNTSIYGGTIVEANVSIAQDPITKSWWLSLESTTIGYFPIALFSNLTSAEQGGWGGRTHAPPGAPSPPMGSGYFPDDNLVHACYFRQVSFKNGSIQDYGPEEYHVHTNTDNPSCFGVEYYGDQGRQAGYSLQFGGPGGNYRRFHGVRNTSGVAHEGAARKKMMNIFLFVLCLVINNDIHIVHGIQNTLQEDLELERQLQLINKPHIKSIRTKFGDIIDCIDINKQPAFDHPLLKNHKLQRKPNFKTSSVKNSWARLIFGLEKHQYCPTGTVPIQTITKDDLIRDKLLNSHTSTQSTPGDHFAEVSLVPGLGPYYGVSGSLSIYNPKVEKDQSSASVLWVRNEDANRIVLGWHVNPSLYGDDATHIYSRWTRDNYEKTGCFNMQCPGFVQTNKRIYLGTRVDITSIYGGRTIETNVSITQDPITKNWWLNIENTNIGYFPIALFSNMASAQQGGWGGKTHAPPGAPSPPMGSGYFPDKSFIHACYFRDVSFKNGSTQNYGSEEYHVNTETDKPSCFGVKYYGNQGRQLGYSLQFGGPGGNCGN
ncbi:uncharacterized protein LOC114384190 [Glycine soja]|uniref:uncharacterized protein LOC114384190 n=1 Tax=Glycine soja TaxID=3848 RepID=UPI00103BEA72|nr:uncharacterized protein LOC114384190 [Glycine soja]